tara:strand:- start:244 stop:594 length:351 start_codon:yes stop_codon:yes gene_type:complete
MVIAKSKSLIKKIIIYALFANYSYASAATIELKSSTDLLENYALFGVARLCTRSKSLSTMERLEMRKIQKHYDKVVENISGDLPLFTIAVSAAGEVYGITYSSTLDYSICSRLLKK